jgi:hypothetical protein
VVLAKIGQIDAFAAQPLHQPAAVLGDSARQILARIAFGAGFDLVHQLVFVDDRAGEIDVERAVGDP